MRKKKGQKETNFTPVVGELFTNRLLSEYNYDGTHNKLPFKKLKMCGVLKGILNVQFIIYVFILICFFFTL